MAKFKKGDRVIPIKKSTGKSLDMCNHWRDSKERGYMYVRYIETDGTNPTYCVSMHNDGFSGNFYRESDLIPFGSGVDKGTLFKMLVNNEINDEQYTLYTSKI